MEKLTILEFSTETTHIYNVDSDADIDEDYIKNLGYRPSRCIWMFGNSVIAHKEILK